MDIGYIVTVLAVILISMMLHELAHGYVALRLGDETARLSGRLSFNPLKHIDPVMTVMLPLIIIVTNSLSGTHMPIFGGAKPVPFNPANVKGDEWGVAAVALSGPLTNFVIAFVCYAVFALSGVSYAGVIGTILATAVAVNLGFFVFNMIPIPPLDGSRFLYALAPDFIRTIMDKIEQFGVMFILVIVMLFNQFIMTYMSAAVQGCLWLLAHIFGVPL